MISANIFESQTVLIHSVVGAADTRYMVANSGGNELRKITWLVKNKILNYNLPLIFCLIYNLYVQLVRLTGLSHLL